MENNMKTAKKLNYSPREWEALQRATSALRAIQPTKTSKRAKSGHTGIYWQFEKSRWTVNVPYKGKSIYAGVSKDLPTALQIQKRKIKNLIKSGELPVTFTI